MLQSPAGGGHDGLRPARLSVGIISAGRVGTAIGAAWERAEHVVAGCSAVSSASRERARRWLPDTPVLPIDEVAVRAELLLLAVPDAELPALVTGLAATGAVRANTIVVPGGKMELAMQLIFTPFVWRMMDRKKK